MSVSRGAYIRGLIFEGAYIWDFTINNFHPSKICNLPYTPLYEDSIFRNQVEAQFASTCSLYPHASYDLYRDEEK